MKKAEKKMTKEEVMTAYHAAPPEIRSEVRRLLAEDCRKKGDFEGAERILRIQD